MSSQPEPSERQYNPLFERFVNVDLPDADMLPGMVAYCLYKIAKREWATDFFDRNGRKPNDSELADYIRTWTTTRLAGAEKEAETVILTFANSVIEANEPTIREDALRGTFWSAVRASMTAAFFYTPLLIGFAVVLRFSGIDLLAIFQSI
ncbi:hypothetical protein [Consotaella aegiceratis]|uniref:hypothetical protein n=1 Tax=Consotaella aegiceratis TaxID=3097961 RepID=UPI002F3F2337